MRVVPLSAIAIVLLLASIVRAETGQAAWLRYAPLDTEAARKYEAELPRTLVVYGDSATIGKARDEIVVGVRRMIGRDLPVVADVPAEGAIVVGTVERVRAAVPQLALPEDIGADGFVLKAANANGARFIAIAGQSDRGTLYAAFAWLRRIASGEGFAPFDDVQAPYAPLRWVNEWNNIDGTIERGYGGRSIFWDAGHIRQDLSRVDEYGRLLASLGINGISINNVNANPQVLSPELLPEIARVADVLRPWGLRLAIAIDFGSPQSLGRLPTYDPLDPTVIAWWKARADEIYKVIPDFGGFVLKADSEGRVGPSAYGRTHADAANVVARALAPHGGVIFYRGFVYDHHMDWNNPKNDRARAAYDNFHPLDGQFEDNAIVQIKHGPIDFQVREPPSPLFGALERTNQAIELQITQEYMGQARHTVFLAPMWKEALDFDMHVGSRGPAAVKALVAGRTFHRPIGGFVGVSNVGLAPNWFNNQLSQANLYAFGRLAWNPDVTSRQIADEWTRLTFGSDPRVLDTVTRIQLDSWHTYENYTGPLGLQTLTDIVGNHYGVAVEASERNGWGQWHRADEKGVGMDRTVATGTGFIGQYAKPVQAVYEAVESCPDALLLFMHHVPYTHKLHSGKTVIQFIYDSHYDGAATVAGYLRDWTTLKGRIDDERFEEVRAQLEYQAGQAIVWRDAVTRWFHRASNIADARGRVDNYPGRMEAENAKLEGYVAKPVAPWETASGAGAVECPPSPSASAGQVPPSPSASAGAACSASFQYSGPAGTRDIVVQYFDVNTGSARFRIRVGNRIVGEWLAADRLPTRKIDGSSSSRRIFADVTLKDGDIITIEGMPDGGESAALDYIELQPSGGSK
jgi:alpha-glucuronidase